MLRSACELTKYSSDMTGTGAEDELLFLIGPALKYNNEIRRSINNRVWKEKKERKAFLLLFIPYFILKSVFTSNIRICISGSIRSYVK